MGTSFLGQRLREARQDRCMTIETASSGIGISHNYLGDLERGFKQPSLDLFIDIVNYYGLPADYFLQDQLENVPAIIEGGVAQKLSGLTPAARKVALDVLDTTIVSLKNMEKK